MKTLGKINVSGKRMSRKTLWFPGNSGKPLVKQWICDLDIISGSPRQQRKHWIPVATPCKTLVKQCICSASHRVHGNGVAGITKNLMISRNHWKTLWKSSFCELDTAGFQLTPDLVIDEPHAIYMPTHAVFTRTSFGSLHSQGIPSNLSDRRVPSVSESKITDFSVGAFRKTSKNVVTCGILMLKTL